MLRKFTLALAGVALLVLIKLVYCQGPAVMHFDMSKFGQAEKAAVAQLRDLSKSLPMEDYMKEDYFLARFLVTKNFDVPEALGLLRENLEWRQKKNLSNILAEPWDDMHALFPYSRNTFDVEGRPVVYYDLEKWDIASFLSDDANNARFARYLMKINEESSAHVRQLRSQGKDVSQYRSLMNMAGFSLSKHACLECMYLYRDITDDLVKNYKFAGEKTIFVNTPYLVKTTYSILTDETQRTILVFGQDRDQWESQLEKYIARDQFPAGLKQEGEQGKVDNSEGLMNWYEEL